MHKKFFTWALALCLASYLALGAGMLHAQTDLPENSQITGKTLDGLPFDLAGQKGKLVLVMFWASCEKTPRAAKVSLSSPY